MEKLTYNKIFVIVGALKNIAQTDIEFGDMKDIHALSKNRRELMVLTDDFTLVNKKCKEYDEYIKKAEKLKLTLKGEGLKDALDNLAIEHGPAIEKEIERREKIEELLNKEVEVTLYKIKRSSIKAKTSKDAAFLFDIDLLLED